MYYLILAMVTVTMSFVVGHGMGKSEGRKEVTKAALRTNPPSEELEIACAALWFGDQQKKYYEKEHRRAR